MRRGVFEGVGMWWAMSSAQGYGIREFLHRRFTEVYRLYCSWLYWRSFSELLKWQW
jgi:hypothetical protein